MRRNATEEKELALALTRRFLTSMGIEPEKVDQIIEAHAETVDGLKSQADEIKGELEKARQEAEKVQALEKQVEDMKASDPSEEWKAKYAELNDQYTALKGEHESLESEHEAFKASVEADKAKAEKLSLYRALLRDIGLDEKRVEKASLLKNLDELTVEDGKLVGYEELKEAEAEEWAAFIPQTNVQGAQVPTPPQGGQVKPGADPEISKMLEQRHADLYGTAEK